MGLFDSPTHILIVLVVLVLLFGSAKLPRLAKSLGESMRIFKNEAQKLQHDDAQASLPQAQAQQQQFTQPELSAQPMAAQQPVVNQQPVAQQPVAQQPQYGAVPPVTPPVVPPAGTQASAPVPGAPQTNQPG